MAERFGRHIIRDDGSLDRAAVAEIVFNDEAALKALNDIVHPALGVEITRRIEQARGTDDIVVLDFPLLAERPRPGLERDRGRRRAGGDRGRATGGVTRHERGRRRARIASQVSRDERLAIATHVIDNSGDLDALRDQVDALWEELRACHTMPAAPPPDVSSISVPSGR